MPETFSSGEWSDQPPHPLRRFFARMMDTLINGFFAFVIVAIILGNINAPLLENIYEKLSTSGSAVVDLFLSYFFSTFITAAMIGSTGRSIGKWIFGLKVIGLTGLIGYRIALKREFKIWVRALACGIPLVNFLAWIIAGNRLMNKKITPWDEEMGLRVIARPNDGTQIALSIAGILLLAVIVILLRRM